MNPYFNLLNEVHTEGFDRTNNGVLTKRLNSCTLAIPVYDKFPVLNLAVSQNLKNIISEVIWMISGSTNIKNLNEQDNHIFDHIAITEKVIDETMSLNKDVADEDKALVKQELIKQLVGEVGPMHGYAWRNAPSNPLSVFTPPIHIDDIPSDKRKLYQDDYENFKLNNPNNVTTFEEFASTAYRQTRDQLNELYRSLKINPYGQSHIVTSYNPGLTNYSELPPQINILHGNTGYSISDVSFQCLVKPSFNNLNNKLSLKVNITNIDVIKDLPFIVAKYTILLQLLAHVLNMKVCKIICDIGTAHLVAEEFEKLKVKPDSKNFFFYQLKINQDESDLFSFRSNNIDIESI